MNEKKLCAICGREYDEHELTDTYDEGLVCQDCLDEHFTQCEHCGDYHRSDDTTEVVTQIRWGRNQHEVTELWCLSCAEYYAYVCQDCERWYSDDCIRSDDFGTHVCDRCYDGYWRTCEDCGRIIHQDDAYSDDDDDYWFCSCCWNDNHASAIHSYGHKPDPIFAYRRNESSGVLTFGVEDEVDYGEDARATAKDVTEAAQGRIYCKRDGSLSSDEHGFEIVTHPASLGYHLYDFSWANILRICKQAGFKSHDTETCGLHIHVGREGLGSDGDERWANAQKLVLLAYALRDELTKFSRRKAEQLNRWAPFPELSISDGMTEMDLLEAARDATRYSRYAAVNQMNLHTVEFRIFRGTLKRDTLCASLQLVSNLCKYAMTHTAKECLSATFVDIVNVEPTSLLLDYCQTRRLTVRQAG